MAANYPASLDALTNPTSADFLNSPDHAGQHTNANDIVEAIETTLGTNSGTSILQHFTVGQFPIRATGVAATGTLQQTVVGGTYNNFTAGTLTMVGTATLPSNVVTTTSIIDANVTGRKMQITQAFGSSVTTGTTASATYVDLIAGTFTPAVVSNLVILAQAKWTSNANTGLSNFIIDYNGTTQGGGTLFTGEQMAAQSNLNMSGAGYAFVLSAPASAGTVRLRMSQVNAGTLTIQFASFQVLPFAT